MKSRPIRNSVIKWEKSEKGEVSLIVPQKDVLWVKIISKVFMLPNSRVVVLDEVGSFVWTLCDGYNSIDTIVKALCNRYKLTYKEAETSLLEYFRKLGRRGIIGFAVTKKAETAK
ncbi:MAG: PqqD family protein [bacterium]